MAPTTTYAELAESVAESFGISLVAAERYVDNAIEDVEGDENITIDRENISEEHSELITTYAASENDGESWTQWLTPLNEQFLVVEEAYDLVEEALNEYGSESDEYDQASINLDVAQEEFEYLIREAREQGVPMRDMVEATDMEPIQIREIAGED